MSSRTRLLHPHPDQRQQLLTWIELYPAKTVLEMVASPPPDGFGIKTHLTSLRRSYQLAQMEELESPPAAAPLPPRLSGPSTPPLPP